MSVFKCAEHIGEYLEELFAVDIVARAYLIYFVYRVPVNLLVVEEAVVLIDDLPEGFEVALGGIFVLLLIDAGRG